MDKCAGVAFKAFAPMALAMAICSPPVFGADANPGKVERIEVTKPGIYTADKTTSLTNDAGLTHYNVDNIQFVAETKTIQAQRGLKFGFRYTIYGTPPNAPVSVKQITIYPPEGVVSPKSGILHANAFSTTHQVGTSDIFAGYDIDENWEMVPGVWTIQLWVGDQQFAEESFTVKTDDDRAQDK